MHNSNKPTAGSRSGARRRGTGIAYTLAGIVAVGAIWLGVASGSGAGEMVSSAGTQTSTAQQTSESQPFDSQPSDEQPSDPQASESQPADDVESPAAPGSSPTAEPTADGAGAGNTDAAAPVQEAAAQTAVQRFVETTAALNAVSADASTSELGDLADGAALEELKVQGDEMAVNRWTLDGEADVDGVEILSEPSSSEQVLQVQACVDSSAVALKDENGALIQAAEPAGTRRSLNLYDLEVRNGAWTVVNHYFPDNADC